MARPRRTLTLTLFTEGSKAELASVQCSPGLCNVPLISTELSKELREVMVEVADTEEQVNFWKNYPFNQKLEKREKIKCLKSGIRQIDELHDALEGENRSFHNVITTLIPPDDWMIKMHLTLTQSPFLPYVSRYLAA